MRAELDHDKPLYAARPFEFAGHTFAVGERFATTGVSEEQVKRMWESGAIDHDAHDSSVKSPPPAEEKTDEKPVLDRYAFRTPRTPPREDDKE